MDWQTRRRLTYALAIIIFMCAFVVYLLRDTLFPAPTCFDMKQNGYESGVDCGGTCALVCHADVVPLSVLWARALQTSPLTYDIIGMVSNKNIDNASHYLGYTFTMYDTHGTSFYVIKGTTTAPVDGDFPIIKQSVKLSQNPVSVSLELNDGPHFKVQEKPTSPTLRIANETYELSEGISRVSAVITNTKRITISDLPVRVVLYDVHGNAYAIGETLIPFLDKEQVSTVTFTWNTPLPFSPTRIRVYPIFDPFVTIE